MEKDYIGFLPEQTLSPDMGLKETVEMIYAVVTADIRTFSRDTPQEV